MFAKIWNYFFNRTKVAPLALPASSSEESAPEIVVESHSAVPTYNMFHDLLLEEAERRLKKENEFIQSDKLVNGLRKAMAYMVSHEDIFMSGDNMGIPEDMVPPFYVVFSKLCQEQKIRCELIKDKYIKVSKSDVDQILADLQSQARHNLFDDKVRQMNSVGIYR